MRFKPTPLNCPHDGGFLLQDGLTDLFCRSIGSLPSLLNDAARFAGAVAVVVFLALYISISPNPLVSKALRLVPWERREGGREVLGTLEAELRGWIVGVGL